MNNWLYITALVMVMLNLTGLIHWSWLWVLAPLWIPCAVVVVTWAAVAFIALMGGDV